jgi:hypothetical protein
MKFGVFYEHQLPRPWTSSSEWYADQNEDVVRMIPDQLKQRMAEKEKHAAGAFG